MGGFFKPLSSDCIDYYDFDPKRLVAFAQLDVTPLDRAIYLNLGLALPIGKLRPEVVQNFPLSPSEEGAAQHARAQKILGAYSHASAEVVNEAVYSVTDQYTAGLCAYNREAVNAFFRSLVNFDRQIVGGNKVSIGVDIDDHFISPNLLKAPMWHFDFIPDQVMPTDETSILPEKLSPIARGYAVRLVSTGCAENVQPEYIRDTDLFKNDKPHPLVLRTRQIAKKAEAWRLSFGISSVQIEEARQTNAVFESGWAEFLTEQKTIDEGMKQEGLIHQAEPNEILFATNYSFHRSRRPSQLLKSIFSGLRVRSLA